MPGKSEVLHAKGTEGRGEQRRAENEVKIYYVHDVPGVYAVVARLGGQLPGGAGELSAKRNERGGRKLGEKLLFG